MKVLLRWLAARLPWPGADELPLALIQLDGAGRLCRVNRSWEAFSGYRASECLGHEHEAFLHPEDHVVWQLAWHGLTPAQPLWNGCLRYTTSAGELRWADVRMRYAGTAYLLTLADVSAQMPQREQLLARHRSLSNLLDGLPAMVYRCRNNRHWSMEYVSAGCLELTGYPAERLIDSQELTYNGLIHPHDREQVWRGVQEGLRARRPFVLEYRLLCADGREKWVSERGCGVYSDLGEVLGLEGVVMERGVEVVRQMVV